MKNLVLNKDTITSSRSDDAKVGLVLEGGAMRGLFTCGVIDVFEEKGISFDGVIGVSAGAAFGCNLKSHQPGRALRYNMRFAHDWRMCSLRSLIFTGDLYGADFAYHEMPKHLDVFDVDTYNKNPMEFYCVCTDVMTGKAVYKLLPEANDNTFDWIRASASMPLCSKVVELEGYHLLDGGIADSIPLQYFQSVGYAKNVVILTRPDGYVKGKNRFMPLMRLMLRKYPQFIKAVAQRHEMYNAQLAFVREQERQGTTYVIRPSEPLPIGHVCHDPEQMRLVYELGRQTALQQIDEIKRFINEE